MQHPFRWGAAGGGQGRLSLEGAFPVATGAPTPRPLNPQAPLGLGVRGWGCCRCPTGGETRPRPASSHGRRDPPGVPEGHTARRRLLSPARPAGQGLGTGARTPPRPACRGGADYIPQGALRSPVTHPSPIGRYLRGGVSSPRGAGAWR